MSSKKGNVNTGCLLRQLMKSISSACNVLLSHKQSETVGPVWFNIKLVLHAASLSSYSSVSRERRRRSRAGLPSKCVVAGTWWNASRGWQKIFYIRCPSPSRQQTRPRRRMFQWRMARSRRLPQCRDISVFFPLLLLPRFLPPYCWWTNEILQKCQGRWRPRPDNDLTSTGPELLRLVSCRLWCISHVAHGWQACRCWWMRGKGAHWRDCAVHVDPIHGDMLTEILYSIAWK